MTSRVEVRETHTGGDAAPHTIHPLQSLCVHDGWEGAH